MAQDNVDLIESAWAAFNRGDIDAAVAVASPSAEFRVPGSLPFGGSYSGPEGLRDYVAALTDAFDDFRAVPLKVLGADDEHVVVVADVSGKAGGGERVEVRSAWVYKMRDGAIAEADVFTDTAALLAAIG